MKTLRYIIITLLLVAALQAARGQYVIDKVCLGAQRHYRIDGLANSTYLWQLTDASNNPVTITNPAGTSFTTTNPPTTGSEIIIQWAKPLINPGTYKLIAIQYSQAGCDTLQQGEVQVFDLPTDNAGNPATICAGSTVNLSEASATNYSTLVWTSSGDGVFDNPALLHPVYSPGTNDILSGNVTLTLTADGQGNSGSCTPAVSSLTVTINKVVPASVSATADQTTVCAGATVTFTAVPVNGGTAPVYQWTVNGTNVGTSAATYAFVPVNGDKVSVVMTSNETCVSGNPANSNELTITVNNPLPASVSVTADQTTVCAGATVTFTAVPVNGGTAPVYQWTVNGNNVGTSAATYAFAPVNGDKVSVVMTSNETCVSGNPANSNELTITVNNPLPASVSVTADQTTVCAGATVTFTAVPVNGGTAPVYQWTVNGNNVGTSAATYAFAPVNGDKVSVVMTSNETCVSGNPANSNELIITINNAPFAPIVGTITQPTCTFTTGSVVLSGLPSGNWTINPGTIAGSTTSTTISGLIAGKYNFTVIDAIGCNSSQSADVVIDPVPIAPVAPTASVTVQPTCAVGTGTIVVTAPAEGSGYSYSIDGGTTWSASATFVGLNSGNYNIIVKETATGCISAATTLTVNTAPLAPAAPTASVTVQPTCAVGTGTIVITAPAEGSGYSYSIDGGTTWSASATFVGLNSGNYNIIVKETATGCISAATTLTVNTAPLAPAAPTASVTVQPTCAVGTGTIVVTVPAEGSGYSYSIDGGTTWSASATFAGLNSGNYNIIVKETATGCISAATTLTVNTAPLAPAAPTASVTVQPTCAVGTGTIVITAPAEGSGYSYSIDGGTTWSASATFAGLNSGNYNITVKETATGCISAATTLTVNTAPLAPAAPTASVTVQPTCAVGTGTIVITAPAEGSGYFYSIDGGTTWSASATFVGLNSGNYNITVKETATGCVSAATTLTVNTAPLAPAAPTASVTVQPTCAVGTGTIVITAPAEGSGYSYSIDGGTTWSASATFVGLNSGNYNITVKETATGCISAATTLTVNTAPLAPAAPTASVTVQPTCAVGTGTIVVTVPAEGSGYSYSIDGGTTWSASATFAGLNSGNYNIIVKETATGCISAATTLTVNTAPLAPAAPTASVTVQPTCAVGTGTIVITAPAEGSGYSYSIDGGTTWSASATFAGLNSGNYNITVKETATGCISAATTLTVNTAPLAPAAPTASVTVQPTCAVGTGTIVITAPAEGSGYSYSIDGGTTWSASATFAGLNSGNYNITVKETATGCISAATTLTVNTAPLAPAAPTASVTVQPTCAVGTGTIVITAPAEGSGYFYSIDGGTTWSASATFVGLNSGNYNITVKETATGCVSAATTLTVNTAPLAPAAPTASVTVQPTCAVGTGTIVITAPAEGSGYSYSIDGGTTWSASATFVGLNSGNYNITVKETATGCISAATTLTVNTAPLAPAAPTASVTVQPTCAVGTGTIVVTVPAEGSGYSYSIDGGTTWSASATFAGLNSGNYNITVKETATGCISAATTLTVNTAPLAPAAPTASVTVQPTCAVGTGTIVVTAPAEGSGYFYSIDGGTTWSASATFVGLNSGNYNIIVKETATGCISAATTLTVNTAPLAPAAPTASVTVQPTCAVGTGTIVVTAPAEGSGYFYSIDGGTTWSASATFVGLNSGNYNITVKETATGCISAATTLTVNTAPLAPAAPTASVTVQPTCAVSTGTIVVTAPAEGSGYSYSIDGGTTWSASATFAGLNSGNYNITVKETATGCVSAATTLTVNTAPGALAAPAVGTITQPTCSTATGTVILTGLPATGTWTLTRNPGGTTVTGTGTTTTVSGLTAGTTYTFTVTNVASCTSPPSVSVVIIAAPTVPTAPVIGVITQPTCAVPTGSVVLTGLPATGTWTLTRIPGGTTVTGTGTSRTVSGLTPAVNYTFTVTNTAGCTSLASVNVVINPVALITPSFSAIQPLCKGDDPVVLPIRSNNSTAITGTWSPAIISTSTAGTKRYYFIPDANQCSDTTSISVTIKDWITTNFNPIVNSVCQNTPAPALLTTSLNGITGTWDPPAINTSIVRTTTYSFTPTTGQCASSPTVDVTIIGKINPLIAEIGPFCQGSTPPSLPSSSTNGVTGTWNPSVISTAAIGTRAYNFNPDANQCAWVIAKDITVNPKVKPDFDQIAPLCQNSAAPSLPLKSTNGFTGTWSPSTISTSSAGKTTFTFTPDPDQCATSTTMDITVNEVMNPVFIQIDPLCQNSTAPILPAVSTNGINGTWNPSTISTLAAGTKTYTFTSSPATCPPTAAMNITVNPQVTPLFNAIGPLCQNSTPPTLPINSTNGVTGSWSPATINTTNVTTTKYIFTPNNDQCAVPTTMEITINAPAIPQFTSIGPLCQNGAAPDLPITSTNGITGTWNPGTINTAKSGTTSYQFTPQSGQCAVEKIIDIVINARITPDFNPIGPLCLNSVPPPLPASSLNGITGTWSPAKIDSTLVGKTKYIFNPSANECAIKDTMVVMVNPIETSTSIVTTCSNQLPFKWNGNSYTTSGTYSVKLVSRAGCDSIAKLVLSVITGVTPTFTQVGPFIQNSAAPELPTTSTNGITGTWTPATVSTTDAGTTTYIFTPNLDQCATTTKMDITVQIDAVINGPTVAGSCQEVSLDASQSVGDIVKYEWSILDPGGELTLNSGVKTSFHLSPKYTGTLPANFRVRMVATNRNGYSRSDTITIKMDPLPVADVYASGKLEKDGSMIVDGSVSKGNTINYKWSTTEGKIIGADNQSSVKLYGAGIYNLEVADIHGCLDNKSFKYPLAFHQIAANDDYARTPWDQDVIINILANDWSTVNLLPGSVTITSAPGRGGTKINANGTVTYIPQGKHTSTDKFVYRVCDDAQMCASATVTIDVTDIGIKIPEAFSPNGDGANDKLVFPGLIENYPKSQLYVYTRSGQPVYQSANYLNDWDGSTLTSTLTNLQIVPTGTYYYILKLGGTTRIIKGFIYIGY